MSTFGASIYKLGNIKKSTYENKGRHSNIRKSYCKLP